MENLSSFLHSEGWEAFQNAAGATTLKDQGSLYIHRGLPFRGSYWQSSRCVLAPDWQIPETLKRSWFLRLEPEDHNSYEKIIQTAKYLKKEVAETLSIQPRQTVFLDISQSPEILLANMKQKHRYNIRLAERHGVDIETHTQNLDKQFTRFWHLLSSTAARQGFRTHSQAYYQTMLQELEKRNMVKLSFATNHGEDLATVLVVTHGKVASYLHGASGTRQRESMAPYLLHWRMIQLLHEEGFSAYDFWGSNAQKNPETGEWEPIPGHPSAGTTRFKLGFGGSIVEYPGTFDLILNPFCYTLYKGIRGLRSRKRAFS